MNYVKNKLERECFKEYNKCKEYTSWKVSVNMSMSEAQKRANNAWNEKNKGRYEVLGINLYAGEKAEFKALAAAAGLSVSEYIRQAVREKEARDKGSTSDD